MTGAFDRADCIGEIEHALTQFPEERDEGWLFVSVAKHSDEERTFSVRGDVTGELAAGILRWVMVHIGRGIAAKSDVATAKAAIDYAVSEALFHIASTSTETGEV